MLRCEQNPLEHTCLVIGLLWWPSHHCGTICHANQELPDSANLQDQSEDSFIYYCFYLSGTLALALALTPSPSARNIGAVFDSRMSIEQQVIHVCQVAYWHLHTISTIRSTITLEATVKLVLAFVVSRLDFANAPLLELPDCLISPLQKVQMLLRGWRFALDGVTTLVRS